MSTHYKQFPLDDVKPGMVLSDHLFDSHGQVLLTQGVTLTESMLAALHRHQITMVPVAIQTSEEELQAEHAKHEQRLSQLFRKSNDVDESATGILEQYVRHYRLNGLDEHA